MANRNYGYQYETSPRKLEPEYKKTTVKKKKPIQKKSNQSIKKNNATNVKNKAKTKKKYKMSFEIKFFINSMLFFSIVFAIIACQALVEQRYKERESLKKEYNQMLADSKLGTDLNDDVRILASEYGMQTKSATLIDLGTSDYIESATNKVKVEENVFEKIVSWIKSKF